MKNLKKVSKPDNLDYLDSGTLDMPETLSLVPEPISNKNFPPRSSLSNITSPASLSSDIAHNPKFLAQSNNSNESPELGYYPSNDSTQDPSILVSHHNDPNTTQYIEDPQKDDFLLNYIKQREIEKLFKKSVLLYSHVFTGDMPRININTFIDGPQALVLELKHSGAHTAILSWKFGSSKDKSLYFIDSTEDHRLADDQIQLPKNSSSVNSSNIDAVDTKSSEYLLVSTESDATVGGLDKVLDPKTLDYMSQHQNEISSSEDLLNSSGNITTEDLHSSIHKSSCLIDQNINNKKSQILKNEKITKTELQGTIANSNKLTDVVDECKLDSLHFIGVSNVKTSNPSNKNCSSAIVKKNENNISGLKLNQNDKPLNKPNDDSFILFNNDISKTPCNNKLYRKNSKFKDKSDSSNIEPKNLEKNSVLKSIDDKKHLLESPSLNLATTEYTGALNENRHKTKKNTKIKQNTQKLSLTLDKSKQIRKAASNIATKDNNFTLDNIIPDTTPTTLLQKSGNLKEKKITKAKYDNQRPKNQFNIQAQNKYINGYSNKTYNCSQDVVSANKISFKDAINIENKREIIHQTSVNPWFSTSNKTVRVAINSQAQISSTKSVSENVTNNFKQNFPADNINEKANKVDLPKQSTKMKVDHLKDKYTINEQNTNLSADSYGKDVFNSPERYKNNFLGNINKHQILKNNNLSKKNDNVDISIQKTKYEQWDNTNDVKTLQKDKQRILKKSQTWVGSTEKINYKNIINSKSLSSSNNNYVNISPQHPEPSNNKVELINPSVELLSDKRELCSTTSDDSKLCSNNTEFLIPQNPKKSQAKYNIFDTIPSFKNRNFASRSITDFDIATSRNQNYQELPFFNTTSNMSSISAGTLTYTPLPFLSENSLDHSSPYSPSLTNAENLNLRYRFGNHNDENRSGLLNNNIPKKIYPISYGDTFDILSPSHSHDSSSFLNTKTKIDSKIVPLGSSLPFPSNETLKLGGFNSLLDSELQNKNNPNNYTNHSPAIPNLLEINSNINLLQTHRSNFGSPYIQKDYNFDHDISNKNIKLAALKSQDNINYSSSAQNDFLDSYYSNMNYYPMQQKKSFGIPAKENFASNFSSLNRINKIQNNSGKYKNKLDIKESSNNSKDNNTRTRAFRKWAGLRTWISDLIKCPYKHRCDTWISIWISDTEPARRYAKSGFIEECPFCRNIAPEKN
ncbi:hypothetical protein BB561_000184 [Smittium simulii]|uniref:Uncharacterized protein n=1 Tax=Smittium simulii TaxID=133385 RepID=A0A2T9Z037_9FUNG|nr:hypothetical protein BB561_000184 [Smittium simulii]